MRSSVRKRLTAEQRRAKILSAATQVFAHRGFDEASMNAIAEAAGITKPVLYDHFPSKHALFETLLRSIRDELLSSGKVIKESRLGDETKFRSAVDAFFSFVEARPNAAKVLLIVPEGNREAAELSRAIQADATAAISRLLKNFLSGGASWEPLVAGEFLKEGLHAVAKWWLSNPGASRDQIVDVVMKSCWRGFRLRK